MGIFFFTLTPHIQERSNQILSVSFGHIYSISLTIYLRLEVSQSLHIQLFMGRGKAGLTKLKIFIFIFLKYSFYNTILASSVQWNDSVFLQIILSVTTRQHMFKSDPLLPKPDSLPMFPSFFWWGEPHCEAQRILVP